MEEKIRQAYQKSTGADATPEGTATMTHGIVVDKMTGKFMATFKVSKDHGSISKVFDCRQDAEFWWDSLSALMKQGRLQGNLSTLRQTAANRKATAAAIKKIEEENISTQPESRESYKRDAKEGADLFKRIFSKDSGTSLPAANIHLFKTSVDQILGIGSQGRVDGVLLGTKHANLGWRPTTSIVFGKTFDKESAAQFMVKAGLTKIGIISWSDGPT